MAQQLKRLAVVTGASTGIGYHLAMEFAKNNFDLLVVGRGEKIIEAANAFREFGNIVQTAQIDLAEADGVDRLYSHIKQISCPVDAIAINAGVGVGGASFDKTDLDAEINLIKLNVLSSVHLAKLVIKDMVQEGHGRILFTSSIASTAPGPYEAVYAASKAFIQSFSEALRAEMKDKGITVTALLPGPTETPFFTKAGMEDTKVGAAKKDDPAEVARQGFEALMAGKDKVVAGSFMNKVQAVASKMMSQPAAAASHGNMSKPNSPSKR